MAVARQEPDGGGEARAEWRCLDMRRPCDEALPAEHCVGAAEEVSDSVDVGGLDAIDEVVGEQAEFGEVLSGGIDRDAALQQAAEVVSARCRG